METPGHWPRLGPVGLVARHPVRQEAPGRGVPLRREEVAPVLADEPRAENGRYFGAAGQVPEFCDTARGEDREYAEPQRELVDAETAQVHARTEPVPFQAQHGAKLTTGR